MLFDFKALASELVHVVHCRIKNGEESEKEESPQQCWEVKGKVQGIWHGKSEEFSFLEIGNVA